MIRVFPRCFLAAAPSRIFERIYIWLETKVSIRRSWKLGVKLPSRNPDQLVQRY